MAILEAAVECFSRNGYQGTTMRDLSRASGLGQPTIYHHYGNKEQLFRKALRATHLEIMRVLRRGMKRAEGHKEQLLALFHSVREHHRENSEQIHLIFRLLYTAPPEIRDDFVQRYADDYSNLVRRAFRREREGAQNDPDESVRVELAIHCFHGYLLDLSRSSPGAEPREKHDRLLEFILNR